MQITAGVAIEEGDTVTRQTLFDLWAQGVLGTVNDGELAPNTLGIIAGSNETTGVTPGQIWYDQKDLLWKVYIDHVDDTGCSLFCSFGPDRFDEPVLATEPIPAGAAVRIVEGRSVRIIDGHNDGHVIGFNQREDTAASGTWFPCAVEGICYGLFPFKPAGSTETGAQGAGFNLAVMPIQWTPGGLGKRQINNETEDAWIYGTPVITTLCITDASDSGFTRQLFVFNGPRFLRKGT